MTSVHSAAGDSSCYASPASTVSTLSSTTASQVNALSDDDLGSAGSSQEKQPRKSKLTATPTASVDQMLATLHHVLLQCQELGDQKVRLTGQIMEMLSSKTRQLGLDTKSLGKSPSLG